jgi:hypothetical protein
MMPPSRTSSQQSAFSLQPEHSTLIRKQPYYNASGGSQSAVPAAPDCDPAQAFSCWMACGSTGVSPKNSSTDLTEKYQQRRLFIKRSA